MSTNVVYCNVLCNAGQTCTDNIRFFSSDGTLYWKEDRNDEEKQKRPWFRPYYRPKSADIEITSYALLVYALRRDTKNGLAIARWLAQQRNSLGGYSSTQVHSDYIGIQT